MKSRKKVSIQLIHDMETKMVGLILYLALVLLVPCFSQSITLSVTSQEGCSNGVLAKEHIIKLQSEVFFGKTINNWSQAVVFNITKTSGANKSIIVDLNLMSENKNYTCGYIDKGGYYHVYCEMVAWKDLSGARIRASIGHLETGNIYSATRLLPFIYDRDEIVVSLNGQRINDSCLIYTSQLENGITACCDNSPSPCRIEIRRSGVLLQSGARCITYSERSHEGAQYQLTVHVCDGQQPVKSIICNAQSRNFDEGLSGAELKYDPQLTAVVVLLVVLIIMLITASIVFWKYIRKGYSCLVPNSYRVTHL